jgi:hypothetical protein
MPGALEKPPAWGRDEGSFCDEEGTGVGALVGHNIRGRRGEERGRRRHGSGLVGPGTMRLESSTLPIFEGLEESGCHGC